MALLGWSGIVMQAEAVLQPGLAYVRLFQVLHVRLYIPLLSLSCVVSFVLGLVLCCIVFELL